MTKSPLGGKNTGKKPTDRTKRSVLTDRRGVPLGVAVSGVNAHDIQSSESHVR